ncbi:MAG: CAP domain-containing protein, partial [Oscillibacter sp.]|nr:CAP domain-containing protein [Oscillibacter sp.]
MGKLKNAGLLLTGILAGAALAGPGAHAAAGILAEPSWSPIYVDGQQVSMTAYNIAGNNYVKLRDIGQAVGFNVYWDNGVQVDSDASYTGEAPKQASVPAPESAPAPASESTADAARDLDAIRREAVELTNAVRKEHGQTVVPMDAMLTRAAQVRADEIAATSTYSHTRPDGSSCKTVTDCPYTAENLHRLSDIYLEQQKTGLAQAMVTLLSKSSGHLDNMINPRVTAVGI